VRVGVDTGGTFTDVVTAEGRVAKVPSTTVATNALLERTGAPVALVTTEGFADLIEIARQDRPSLYDAFADRPAPLGAPLS